MILGLIVFFGVAGFLWMTTILYMVWDMWRYRKTNPSQSDGGWTHVEETTTHPKGKSLF